MPIRNQYIDCVTLPTARKTVAFGNTFDTIFAALFLQNGMTLPIETPLYFLWRLAPWLATLLLVIK